MKSLSLPVARRKTMRRASFLEVTARGGLNLLCTTIRPRPPDTSRNSAWDGRHPEESTERHRYDRRRTAH